MDHFQAASLHCSQKYLMNELDDTGVDEFEEHLFGCLDCAEEVRTGASFLTGARPLIQGADAVDRGAWGRARVRSIGHGSRRGARLSAGLAASVMAVLGFSVYQNLFVIPRLKERVIVADSVRVTPSYFLVQSRRDPQKITITADDQQVALTLSEITDRPRPSYRFRLRAAAGRTYQTGTLSPRVAAEEMHVLLPVGPLPDGMYELLVGDDDDEGSTDTRTGDSAPLACYVFTLERRPKGATP